MAPTIPRSLALLPTLAASLLLGCGGDPPSPAAPASTADPAAARTTAPEPGGGRTVVAVLGDSITAGSPLWDPDPAIRDRIGPALDERSQFEYWAARANPGLELRNCGVFGERTDQIALRLDDCTAGADALIVQGGINDIAQRRPVAAAADDLRSMVEAGKQMGLPVAITDVLPWSNGHPAADGPIEQLNEMIGGIAEAEGVTLLPFHDTLEDPGNPGTMRPEWTIDGDHPSIAGYRLLAERAFQLPESVTG